LQFFEFIHATRRGATRASGAALLLLAGCAGFELPWPSASPSPTAAARPAPASRTPPPAVPAAAPVTATGRVLTDADRAEIRRLLRAATFAITDGELTDPPERSALTCYDRVLLIDPENPEARYGIQAIVDRLIDLGRRAAEQRKFDEAERILTQAMLVDPEHSGVRPALTQIRLLETARRNLFRLDPGALDARSANVLGTLHEAGAASRSPGCRAIIRARSDAEGRWIYQEMSTTPGRDRIRAELLIAGTPSIENVCFQDAE
jgi:hypothetical protein